MSLEMEAAFRYFSDRCGQKVRTTIHHADVSAEDLEEWIEVQYTRSGARVDNLMKKILLKGDKERRLKIKRFLASFAAELLEEFGKPA